MDLPNLVIKKSKSDDDQCNFCLTRVNLYELKGDRLTTITVICKECIKKLNNFIINEQETT